MTVSQKLVRVEEQLKENVAQIVPINKSANAVPARSYPSPCHTYQEDAQFPNPFDRTSVTLRPMWRIEETAVQQRKVISISLPPVTQVTGITVSPTSTSATLVAVPDMTIPVNSSGAQVQISWNISLSVSNSTADVSLALFRDGTQIGPTQWTVSPAAGEKMSVSQVWIDRPSTGFHGYSLYWATTSGTITADTKNRSISALILRPQ